MCHILEFRCFPTSLLYFFSKSSIYLATLLFCGAEYIDYSSRSFWLIFLFIALSFIPGPFPLDGYKFLWLHWIVGFLLVDNLFLTSSQDKAFSSQLLRLYLHSAFHRFVEISHLLIATFFFTLLFF
jgi:hypothetical protein